jgi:hypothetical protein
VWYPEVLTCFIPFRYKHFTEQCVFINCISCSYIDVRDPVKRLHRPLSALEFLGKQMERKLKSTLTHGPTKCKTYVAMIKYSYRCVLMTVSSR